MSVAQINAVREFNRFYTRQIGLLDERLLSSRFTLTDVRVLYELAHGRTKASEIGSYLGLDRGYLSRILKRFEAEGLIERRRSPADGRSSALSLRDYGRAEFTPLDSAAAEQIADLLQTLSPAERDSLLNSMSTILRLLGGREQKAADFVLREPDHGDIGWAIERHGTLYWEEFGWDFRFEALVAQILGEFLEKRDCARERAWIAEVAGQRAGCVFLVRNAENDQTAQLRCLLVERSARGSGLGSQLVAACIEFARQAGYARMVLWTNDVLVSARRIYEAAGFKLIKEEAHHSFGQDLVGQTWMLEL